MNYVKTIIKLSITAAIFLVLYWRFDLSTSEFVTRIVDWRWIVVAAFLPLTIVQFFSVNRWKYFLKINGIQESSWALWYINWVSMFQGLLFPSTQGFDLLRVYYIEKRNPSKRGLAGSTIFIERLFGVLILCGCALIALPFVATSQELIPLSVMVVMMNVAAIGGFALVTSRKFSDFYSKTRFTNPVVARVFRYLSAFHAAIVAFPYRRVLLSTVLLIGGFQLSLIAVVYFIFRGYGYEIPFVYHLAIYPLIGILSMAPITIGGFGVREGFFVYFYAKLGVPAEVAVGASLLNYALTMLVPACCGGLLYLSETIRRKEIAPGPPDNH